MLLKFPEPDVIKIPLILLITFCFGNVYPQNSQENSLNRKSAEILERNISFHWPGGPLPELLKELSQKENINFSYSREKTNHITVSDQNVHSENISSFLSRILFNSGYTFIVIGKTIAIVEDKNQPRQESIIANDPPDLSAPVELPASTQNIQDHIYPNSSIVARLPYHIRKELRKIYRQELRMARKHHEDSTEQGKESDTLTKQNKKASSYLKSGLFLSANAGLSFFQMRHQSDIPDWKKQLDFKHKTRSSFCAAFYGGFTYKKFIVETGIWFNKIKIENSYVENSATMKMVKFPEDYTVFTIPANIIYYKKSNKFLLGAGPGVEASFIERKAKKNKMKPYYDRIKGPDPEKEKYSESTRSFVPGINLKVFTEYEITEKWSLMGNFFLNIPLSAYHTNSVYRLYPNTICVQVCLNYSFL